MQSGSLVAKFYLQKFLPPHLGSDSQFFLGAKILCRTVAFKHAAYITNASLAIILHYYISGHSNGMGILDVPMMYMCKYPCKQKQP